ncbi:MAG: general secretion pathway protein GspA, partial [Deltaproteobacteria bacterium]
MYEKFFGLKKRPFVLTPDPEFLYLSKIHDLALTHLEYGIINNAGFIAVTGDIGSGKTTLIKYLFEKIKDILDIAMIFNTNLDPQALLELLVKEFELQPPSSKKSDLFDTLADHFIAQYSKGKRCVIIVDEAQNLPFES